MSTIDIRDQSSERVTEIIYADGQKLLINYNYSSGAITLAEEGSYNSPELSLEDAQNLVLALSTAIDLLEEA